MAIPLSPGIYPFGARPDGQAVEQIVLSDGTLGVALLSQGAILQDVRLDGVPYGLTIGTDTLAPYLNGMRSAGSLIGPVINRISNASAVIDGETYQFDRNQDGKHTRHAGDAGTQHKLWDVVDVSDTAATLELNLPDGEGGFPGNRAVAARFSLIEPGTLELRVAVTSDKTTIINFANHSYWNLDGTETYAGHSLQIAADRRCLAENALVTGEVVPVDDSFFDFRQPRILTPGQDPVLDVNMCLADRRRKITDVLTLTGQSGVSMTIATTEPGIQIYDGERFANDGALGHDRRANGPYCGLAIEAQGWPDAPNQPHFPQITLTEGRAYEQVTRFRFSKP